VEGTRELLAAQRRGQQLLGVEGVALRARGDGGRELGRLPAGPPREQQLDLVRVQRPQLQPGRRPGAEQLPRHPRQPVVGAQLVAAVGGDDQDAPAGDGVGQEDDQVQGGGVGPVRVLEHQQQRPPLLAEPVEDGQRLLEQAQLRVGGAGGRGRTRRRGQLRHQPRQLTEPAGDLAEHRRAVQRPQRLHQRQVRQAAADQVDAAPAQDGRPTAQRPLGQLIDEPRLADPGVAGDQHGAAATGRRRGHRGLQPRQLAGAPDQAPRRHLGSHPATIRLVARCAAHRLTGSIAP
jgi:hypothetical protein